jgi:hypothetical protein
LPGYGRAIRPKAIATAKTAKDAREKTKKSRTWKPHTAKDGRANKRLLQFATAILIAVLVKIVIFRYHGHLSG